MSDKLPGEPEEPSGVVDLRVASTRVVRPNWAAEVLDYIYELRTFYRERCDWNAREIESWKIMANLVRERAEAAEAELAKLRDTSQSV